MKGLPIAALAQGNSVQIWFSSPTGDSSDSFQMNLPTRSEDQAISLSLAYGEMINKMSIITTGDEATEERLDNLRQTIHEYKMWEEAHLHEISELKEKLELYKFAFESQRVLIVDLKEQVMAGTK